MDLRVEHFPGKRLAYLRTVGPYWDVVGPAFDRLFAIARAGGWMGKPGVVPLAVYLDSPRDVPLDQLRADVGLTVDDAFQPPADVLVRTLPPGRFAVHTHIGPYADLRDAWQRAHGQVHQAGLSLRAVGECFELYLNDPSNTPEPQLRTEIYLPIQ